MSIVWTIVIGFIAGVIAKLIHPGPNEPRERVSSGHLRGSKQNARLRLSAYSGGSVLLTTARSRQNFMHSRPELLSNWEIDHPQAVTTVVRTS